MTSKKWRIVRIGDIGDIVTGKTPPTKDADNFGEKYLFLTPTDMNDQKFITTTTRKLSEQGKKMLSRQLLTGTSICVSCIGSDMGKVAMVKEEVVTNQQINSITNIKGDYYPDFIYYSLKPMKDYLHSIAGGSTMPIINKGKFSEIKIKVPSFERQAKIAGLLSTLDYKIELNNQTNQTLEDMAQAIFKHWFVDFEFPNENGEPYKSSGGKFVESELGMIPEGWKITSLDSIANYQNGLAMQRYRPHKEEHSLPVLKIKELNKGFTDDTSDRCRADIHENVKISNGDIIFSWSGTLLVKMWFGGDAGLNQHLFKVTSEEFPKWYYYYWTKLHLEEFVRIATDRATTMGHIKRSHLKEAKVTVPDIKTLSEMTKIMTPIIEKKFINGIQIRSLVELRDTLLPKLMSGEIRIHDAEQEVEACLQKNN